MTKDRLNWENRHIISEFEKDIEILGITSIDTPVITLRIVAIDSSKVQ